MSEITLDTDELGIWLSHRKEQTMSEALKPCPFCGSDDVTAGFGVKYAECNTCDAFGPTAAYPDNAIGAWNTRAALAAMEATDE